MVRFPLESSGTNIISPGPVPRRDKGRRSVSPGAILLHCGAGSGGKGGREDIVAMVILSVVITVKVSRPVVMLSLWEQKLK
jgi:hypothetical protein